MEKNMKLSWLRVLRTGIGALLLTIGAQAQAEESIDKSLGEEVTLVPKYTGSPSEINWKVNGDKLVDMEMNPLDITFYRLQDRATIGKDGSLTITNLNKGDIGLYKAEVLVINIIQETNINLTLNDCPAKPIITSKTIDKKTIELTCNSATPDVKYEWRDKTKILSNQQSYKVSRSSEDVTLTCVVYNDGCRINSTELVPLIPVSGLSGGAVVGIVVGVLILLFLLPIIIFPDHPWTKRIIECLPCLTCCLCKSKKTNGEQNGGGTQGEAKPFIEIQEGGNRNDVESGNAAKNENKNGMQEQENEPSIGLPEEVCGSVSLKLFPSGEVQSMELWKDVMSVSAGLGPPETIESLCLAVEKVEHPEDYTATVKLANGETCVSTMKDPANIAPITSDGGAVKLDVPNAGDMEIDLKEGDKTPYRLTVEGLKVQINDLILEPESVAINKLKPKDSGKYKVVTHCADDRRTEHAFNLEVNQTLNKSQTKRKVKLIVKRMLTYDPPENGLPDGEPIGNITFHPINITNVASIAWKKDNQLVDTKGNRIEVGQQGDLVINDVISEDAGSYTVHSEGQTLEQEFILRL